MKALFIESMEFTEWVAEYLEDDAYSDLQQELMKSPQAGSPMKGCGGLRKIRFRDPKRGKGKRGGVRIIYLYVPEAKWFYLLDIYDKDEKIDLSNDEKKVLSELAKELKTQAKSAAKH